MVLLTLACGLGATATCAWQPDYGMAQPYRCPLAGRHRKAATMWAHAPPRPHAPRAIAAVLLCLLACVRRCNVMKLTCAGSDVQYCCIQQLIKRPIARQASTCDAEHTAVRHMICSHLATAQPALAPVLALRSIHTSAHTNHTTTAERRACDSGNGADAVRSSAGTRAGPCSSTCEMDLARQRTWFVALCGVTSGLTSNT